MVDYYIYIYVLLLYFNSLSEEENKSKLKYLSQYDMAIAYNPLYI